MAEIAVSLVVDLLTEEFNRLVSVHNEFIDIKDELESIQAFLVDADKRAASTKGDNTSTSEGVKTWVKQVREAAFRIEDIVDDYLIRQKHPDPGHSGCVALLHKLKTVIFHRRISYEIQDIKSSLFDIKERSLRYHFQCFSFHGSTGSTISLNSSWRDPRLAALYMEEADVIGFEAPRHILTEWLVNGREERTVVSVVGMGGQGKTTLVKKVFDSEEVIGHFKDCCIWIKVSRSYTVKRLLRDLLNKFGCTPSRGISKMDRESLINEVRNYLQDKRYLIVFDDVWSVHFWDDIEFAAIDNKKGSRIVMTTRNMNVVMCCKKSSFVEVHELQPLTEEQSLQLFDKKAFQFDYDGCCPKEFIGIANAIVKKCKGLPLAIVAIGGLLSSKEKNSYEWHRYSSNLSFELKHDSHLNVIKKILGYSYDELPYNLKPCLLYFGVYPDSYKVKSKRLIQQWIAEGFVMEQRGKTLEEVAEGYLIELIHRNLVQLSSARIDGKPKTCLIHDRYREMILEKIDDSSFCKHIREDVQSSLSGITRRLSIVTTSNDLKVSTQSLHVRSVFAFIDKKPSLDFGKRILTKCKLVKVLDFEDAPLFNVAKNLGSLMCLKYLRLRYKELTVLPKSIGMLQNLETLDVKGTNVCVLPKEISKLIKLRHLIGNQMSLIQLKDGISGMRSLQTLCYVDLNVIGVIELIREVGKLKQLKELGLVEVGRESAMALSSSLNNMQLLEKLNISKLTSNDEVIDLDLISPPPTLQIVRLHARLERLPEWIPKLQNVVQLKLEFSHLNEDPMKSLQSLQNLLSLSIIDYAYEGESLLFQDGGFQKLKELFLAQMRNLNLIVIEKGALYSLKKLELRSIPQMEMVPAGIQNLTKLQVLSIWSMHSRFVHEIAVVVHVPLVEIDGNVFQHSRS